MATGTSNPELIYGSHDDDELFALAGDDTIYAGRGSDWVYGGDGNDTIYGDRTPVIYGDDSLTAVEDYAGSVTFVSENTASRSALGVYKIAADGSIYDVGIVFSNASADGQQQDLIAGVSKADLNIVAGEEIRFFLAPDALNMKGNDKQMLADERSSFVLRDGNGDLATASSTGNLNLYHVNHANGKDRQRQPTFFSAGRQQDPNPSDGEQRDPRQQRRAESRYNKERDNRGRLTQQQPLHQPGCRRSTASPYEAHNSKGQQEPGRGPPAR